MPAAGVYPPVTQRHIAWYSCASCPCTACNCIAKAVSVRRHRHHGAKGPRRNSATEQLKSQAHLGRLREPMPVVEPGSLEGPLRRMLNWSLAGSSIRLKLLYRHMYNHCTNRRYSVTTSESIFIHIQTRVTVQLPCWCFPCSDSAVVWADTIGPFLLARREGLTTQLRSLPVRGAPPKLLSTSSWLVCRGSGGYRLLRGEACGLVGAANTAQLLS